MMNLLKNSIKTSGNNSLFWIYLLSSSVYFVQGIEGLPSLSLFFFMKEKLNFNPSTIMYIGTITSLAWTIKPLWGYLCDNYLSQKKWILLSLSGSLLICLYLGLSLFIPLTLLIVLLSFSNFNTALRDVSVDGLMCIKGKETNSCGKIQSLQWISITIASIIVGLVGGHIADHYNYQLGYLCLIPTYLIIMIIVLKYKSNNSAIKSSTTLWNNILSYKELFTNKNFLLTCLFIFLFNFNPSFGTPLTFIERDVFKWSGQFMGILGAITSSVSILGAAFYFKYEKKIDIKKCLLYSVYLGVATTLLYLYFTPISAIVYGIIFSIIGMFIFLNVMSWMASATITGKEATSFALLCSINNLSGTVSTLTGAWLYPLVGLQWLIIISALTSLLCLPIIKHLKIKESNNVLS